MRIHQHSLLRWTRFASNPFGTGPEKRSAQIADLARNAGLELDDIKTPVKVSRVSAWCSGVGIRLRHGRHASVDNVGIGLLGYRHQMYEQALAKHTGAKVLLWETTYDDILPTLARAHGYRVVAVPHNLESLVSDSVFRDKTYEPGLDLAAEINRLRLADYIFTISREERWLLEARGLQPDYLPYFPTDALADECAKLRTMRQLKSAVDGFVDSPILIMGSAFNPATAQGMQIQLEWLSLERAKQRNIVIVGPETDRIFSDFASPNVTILGAVSREKLVELLGSCAALLVHTLGGAGAVTRIPEALLAGVPIITNSNGARDQYDTAGVYVYETTDEFIKLVDARLPVPPTPAQPTAAIERFSSILRHLAEEVMP